MGQSIRDGATSIHFRFEAFPSDVDLNSTSSAVFADTTSPQSVTGVAVPTVAGFDTTTGFTKLVSSTVYHIDSVAMTPN
jgi:hypothetical protein